MEREFIEKHKEDVQEWVIAYKKESKWVTVNIIGEIPQKTVEKVLEELNQNYDTIYARKIMGVLETDTKKNYAPKGEFIGIL